MKVREFDQKIKDIPVSHAFLTNNRLTYFIDPKDETSVMGSIELKHILTPIQNVDNFPSCFEVRTLNNDNNCVICVENEKSS